MEFDPDRNPVRCIATIDIDHDGIRLFSRIQTDFLHAGVPGVPHDAISRGSLRGVRTHGAFAERWTGRISV